MIFIDRSGYTMDDLTFGGMLGSNGTFTFETSTLSYRLYSSGLTINSEIKLLNLAKKTNFYISPSLGYRRAYHVHQTSSNPNIEVSEHPEIKQGFLIDWGIELGIKLQRLKFGLTLRDVLNKSNQDNTSFIITNAFGISVGYIIRNKSNRKKKEKVAPEE